MVTSPAEAHPTNVALGVPTEGAPPGVPASGGVALPRALVILGGAAAVVIVVAGVQAIAWLIGPAFMALIIVIAVTPVQSWLLRKGWPGWASTLVIVILIYAIMTALALSIIISIARLATELPKYVGQADNLLSQATAKLAALGVGPAQIQEARSSLNIGNLAGLIGALLGSVAGLASSFVFLLVLMLFLSVETTGVGDRVASIAADRPKIAEALRSFAHGTRQYLLVTTVFGFIVAVLDTAALALMGVPLAVTWGVLAFVTNYIPNIGFILGLVPPALLALLVGGPGLMVGVIAVYCVLNLVIQSLIQPRFIGEAVGLSITVTFVALVFWAWLLGGLGAILAIPLTLFVKALLVDIDPRAGWADAWLRSGGMAPDPNAPPPVRKSRRHRQRPDERPVGA
jgi:AI-2 transport protein TqsA